ncbi:hypothetical protein N7462_011440 [Penicillium macrosclerotiorum]|uniref:uncharacterized protein n=1 Tax=Penicillium macrosclerotiorum TaxID=303699 RepID=UPI00254824E2|nr:uncharacterized protein N7462_011440 [Penicillium macrosclerotiorum]KAJ5664627.1 hypothetical protein N7462_011440 [Penicillium macrosclerotiorum]
MLRKRTVATRAASRSALHQLPNTTMQIPTVTLDLQAFQAAHFPGHQTVNLPTAETAFEEDDDGLGYYPDGVKRTLTDEQIRIFRHSEIHALLRAKQLQEDDAEYEARRIISEEGSRCDNSPRSGEAAGNEENAKETKAQVVRRSSVGDRSQKKTRRETQDAPSETLDYEDNESQSTPQNRSSQPRMPPSGRRIVSYDD